MMKTVKIINKRNNEYVALNVQIADTFFTRMKGLLGREGLEKDQGLIITRCQSIHMFFMKFSIDVLFLNKEMQVVGMCHSIKPFRLSPLFFKANKALELPSGLLFEKKIFLGDPLELIDA